MPKMEIPAPDWVAFTPEADCLLQVRSGEVEFETEAVEANRFGVILSGRQAYQASAGTTVYMRNTGGFAQFGAALIARVNL